LSHYAIRSLPPFPTLLSSDLLMTVDPLIYRTVWWALGHSSQQVNVAMHVTVWYFVAAVVLGAKPMSERVSRMAFFLYILFLQLRSEEHTSELQSRFDIVCRLL